MLTIVPYKFKNLFHLPVLQSIRAWNGVINIIVFSFLLLLIPQFSYSQNKDSIKVVTYNLLRYPDISSGAASAADTSLRHPHYRTIVNAINPDILVVEEVQSATGFNWFLTGVMNASQNMYSGATFFNGPDMDAGLFYKTSKFQFISTTTIVTDLRNIYEYKLRHILSGDTLRVYAVHLKASSGTSNEQQRLLEVDSLRKVTNALPSGSNFIVCGDFNIYGDQEPAYARLLQIQSGVEGHFVDMISLSGIWNNVNYSAFHTQSTRTRNFGGGSTGGVDDRFDMILYSKAIADAGGMEVVPNSLIPIGNDGNHYNDSINSQPNTSASAAVVNALHAASDHLPVLMKFTFTLPGTTNLDVGVSALNTNGAYCLTTNGLVKVKVKNYYSSAINFSTYPTSVIAMVTNPNSVIQNFNVLLNSGILNPGQDTVVSISQNCNMSISGTYNVEAYTVVSGDINASNNAMPSASFSVLSGVPANVSPAGPIQICNGNSVTLTASSGVSFLWSTGVTSSSILVNSAGSYSVTITSAGGCTSLSNVVVVSIGAAPTNSVLFSENIGTVTTTTSIAAHETANGFQNINITMSGTADVRVTSFSNNYLGASGGANVFLTNVVGRYFAIAGINTTSLSNMEIEFGLYKSTVASTGVDLKVQVSTDGINFTDLSFAPISGGSGWYLRSATGNIPQTSNLYLRFYQSSASIQFRVDDVKLKYIPSSIITAVDTVVCNGNSILLNASSGANYLWNTGATTQSIVVNTAGNYSVFVDCISSPVKTIYNCNNQVQLHLKYFIEGFYTGSNQMTPRLYTTGVSNSPFDCDSVLIEWRNVNTPYQVMSFVQAVMNIYGDVFIVVPPALLNQSYYLVIKHPNAVETWSKFPVLMNGNPINFSLTGP